MLARAWQWPLTRPLVYLVSRLLPSHDRPCRHDCPHDGRQLTECSLQYACMDEDEFGKIFHSREGGLMEELAKMGN